MRPKGFSIVLVCLACAIVTSAAITVKSDKLVNRYITTSIDTQHLIDSLSNDNNLELPPIQSWSEVYYKLGDITGDTIHRYIRKRSIYRHRPEYNVIIDILDTIPPTSNDGKSSIDYIFEPSNLTNLK